MVTRAVGDCECDAMMDRGVGEVGARVLRTVDSVHRYIIGARTKRLSQHAAALTASQRRVSLLYVVLPASDQRKKTQFRATRQTDTAAAVSIRHDTRSYFKVRSNADTSQLNLPHGTSL